MNIDDVSTGKTTGELWEEWMKGIGELHWANGLPKSDPPPEGLSMMFDELYTMPGNEDHTRDILVIQHSPELVPKWRWFKPPRWKIFRWAYTHKVEHMVLLKDCYPAAMKSNVDVIPDKEVTFSFDASPYADALADILKEDSNAKIPKQTSE